MPSWNFRSEAWAEDRGRPWGPVIPKEVGRLGRPSFLRETEGLETAVYGKPHAAPCKLHAFSQNSELQRGAPPFPKLAHTRAATSMKLALNVDLVGLLGGARACLRVPPGRWGASR